MKARHPPFGAHMADEWFYQDDSKAVQGPFSTEQLKHWMTLGAFQLHVATR